MSIQSPCRRALRSIVFLAPLASKDLSRPIRIELRRILVTHVGLGRRGPKEIDLP